MHARLAFAVVAWMCGVPATAHATYSIVAVDTATRQVGGAGTSCIGSNSVRIIYGSVPDKGVVHAQALLGGPGKASAVTQVGMDIAPATIIANITASGFDSNAQRRQYGIVDLMARSAGFSGTQNGAYADDRQDVVGTFPFSVQGNILTSAAVIDQASAAFAGSGCDLADRLMLALEAGAQNGQGDSRCTPGGIPSDSAFIQVDRPGEAAGSYLLLDVTGTAPNNPLVPLRTQYNAWRATHPCPPPAADAGTGGGGDAGLEPGDEMGGCCDAGRDPRGSLLLALIVALALAGRRSGCEVHETPQPALCKVCAHVAAQRKSRMRTLVVIVGAGAATAGIVAYLSTRPKKPPPPPKPEEGDVLEKYKRERLAATPCDEQANLDLVEHLMINKRWQDALDVALASQKCGDMTGMKLRILTCRQQLRQWAEASVLIEEMIADYPRDTNAWWWHGETWRYRDQPELAMIDFRQSLANAYWSRGSIAVRLFMYAAEPAKAPCEAYRAWRYYERELGGSIDSEARNLIAALDREKTCVPERGTGRGRLVGNKRLKTTIGKTTAELMLDPRAGTTIISRDVAERAGLVPTSTGQTATLWSEVRIQAQPARVDHMAVGGLAAKNVDVAISDDLAVGDDGVIGLSFLWHFDVLREENAATLSPPQ